MLTQSSENYLKTIYKLQLNNHVSTNDIAYAMNVAPSSVTKMIKRLSEMKLVEHESHKGVLLTGAGEKRALRIIRKHRLLELFLVKVLDYKWDEVHDEACMLEHFISDKFEERINRILENPKYDPHGEPIPDKEGNIAKIDAVPLMDVDENKIVVIRWIAKDSPELLQYLEQLGMLPSTELMVKEKHPYGGPIVVRTNSKIKMIGIEAAANIYVTEVNHK